MVLYFAFITRSAPKHLEAKGAKKNEANAKRSEQQNLYLGLKKQRSAHLFSVMGKGKSRALMNKQSAGSSKQ